MSEERLKLIKYDENLSEFDLSLTTPCNDRLMTKLTLDDYDWMTYTFEGWLPTKTQGLLYVKVEYVGTTSSTMTVTQYQNDNESVIHKITFDTDLFIDFIKDYMTKHIAQWDSEYAFCGEEETVNFFNAIINNHTDYTIIDHTK